MNSVGNLSAGPNKKNLDILEPTARYCWKFILDSFTHFFKVNLTQKHNIMHINSCTSEESKICQICILLHGFCFIVLWIIWTSFFILIIKYLIPIVRVLIRDVKEGHSPPSHTNIFYLPRFYPKWRMIHLYVEIRRTLPISGTKLKSYRQ